jgi:two-component system NtrC family sensor kinase
MCLPSDHANREEVEIISLQTERMAKIVGNLLVFARQKSLDKALFPIHELLDDIVGQIGRQADMKAIEVVREYAPELDQVCGDQDQLRQVFVNLLLNAAQAMPKGGTLRLATRSCGPGNGCEVVISDSGEGIQPEHLKNIFTPFFTTKGSGTGLGLSVSYGIVKDHGGEIGVQSSPGQGTSFRVLLPAQEPA